MAPITCPNCGQPYEPGRESAEESKQETRNQAQLMAYAQDLATAYAMQKQMAQYLPGDLRHRISQGSKYITAERLYVTVLFADLVNFTRLAARLDAEEVFSLMNACFQRLVANVLEYDGVIDKFMGDGLMALFGTPEAHEDDPERAVRAALDMQREMQTFGPEMQPRLGGPLQIHIGINSGEVIGGTIGVDEQLSYTVMGETVNLAFRLQQRAEPGSILVGESVYWQTKHLFDYQYLGDFTAKGFDSPVPVYGVRHEREAQIVTRPPGAICLPWMGRDQELAQLAEAWHCLSEGKGGIAVVLGEAGLGKTRLVKEWLDTLPPEAVTIWRGTARMFQDRISYSLWRDLLQRGLDLHQQGASAATVTPDQSLLAQLGNSAPSVLALIGNQSPESEARPKSESPRSQTLQAVQSLLVAQATHKPLILVVDNWQWADELSRDLMLALLPLARQYPILFCILSRPEAGRAPNPAQEIEAQVGQCFRRIELGPLWLDEGWGLLSSVINPENLADEARSAILTWAQGNPLYLKELLWLMNTEGIVEAVDSNPAGLASVPGTRWRVTEADRLASLRVPPTLSGLVRVNLDRLPTEQRDILDYAAAIGPTFSLDLLQAVVTHEREIGTLPAQLQELVAYGILEPVQDDSHTFAFQHALVQETVYRGLLSHRRQAIHRLVADELEILPDSDTDASVELMSHHFHQAGVPGRAVPYLIRAGRRAQDRGAHRMAIEHFLAALAALDNAPRYRGERLGLEMALADTYVRLGQYSEAAALYQSALEQSTRPETRADICRLLSSTYAGMGDWKENWTWLEKALEYLAEGHVPASSTIRGQVYAGRAQAEWRQGNHQRAELWARESIIILEGSQASESLAICYEMLSDIYTSLGREGLADQHANHAASLRQDDTPHGAHRTAYLPGQRPGSAAKFPHFSDATSNLESE